MYKFVYFCWTLHSFLHLHSHFLMEMGNDRWTWAWRPGEIDQLWKLGVCDVSHRSSASSVAYLIPLLLNIQEINAYPGASSPDASLLHAECKIVCCCFPITLTGISCFAILPLLPLSFLLFIALLCFFFFFILFALRSSVELPWEGKINILTFSAVRNSWERKHLEGYFMFWFNFFFHLTSWRCADALIWNYFSFFLFHIAFKTESTRIWRNNERCISAPWNDRTGK